MAGSYRGAPRKEHNKEHLQGNLRRACAYARKHYALEHITMKSAVNALFDFITQELVAGRNVGFKRLGKFKVIEHKYNIPERIIPIIGPQPAMSGVSRRIRFVPVKPLKKLVKQGSNPQSSVPQ